MKHILTTVAASLLALHCYAEDPVFTLYNKEGTKPTSDIRVMIRTLYPEHIKMLGLSFDKFPGLTFCSITMTSHCSFLKN